MGSSMGAMIQAQQRQNQHTDTISAQAGRREFYRDWALASMMGYAQVYTETGTQIMWGIFKMYKEFSYNWQELLARMMYWAKKNGIEIDTSVFFVKLAIDEMAKTKFNPRGPVEMHESAKMVFHHCLWSQGLQRKLKKIFRGKRQQLNLKSQELNRRHWRWKKSDPRRLPRKWYELKEMLATFAALLWVFFGDVCPLYDQVLKIWRVLNHP